LVGIIFLIISHNKEEHLNLFCYYVTIMIIYYMVL